jgi:excisionase family DNA binding protein
MGKLDEYESALSSVNDRLVELVDFFEKGKKAAFARKVDISPQAAQEILAGRRSEPSFKVLVKILQSYPQVRTEWLVLGNGPMLQPKAESPVQLKREVDLASQRLSMLKEQLSALREQHTVLGQKSVTRGYTSGTVLNVEQQAEYNKILSLQRELVEQARPMREEMNSLTNALEFKNKQFDYLLDRITTPQATLSSIYRTKGAPDFSLPFNGLLAQRLNISEATIQQLISEGRLRAVNVGEEGYRVTELAVKEFLGEAPTSTIY